jgi:hypothetical protein
MGIIGVYHIILPKFCLMVLLIFKKVIPLRIIPPIIMGSIAYYMIGLRNTSITHFLWFILILVLFNIVAGSM